MKRAEKLEILSRAAKDALPVRVVYEYDNISLYGLPLAVSEKFLMLADEDDFLFDGYTIRKISDIGTVEIQSDLCSEFLAKEKTFAGVTVPEVDLSEWQTVFASLKESEKFIIVESNGLYEDEFESALGSIIHCNESALAMASYDSRGERRDLLIAYDEITCVSFRNRYVNVWAKYFA